jgi:hypothetical protein
MPWTCYMLDTTQPRDTRRIGAMWWVEGRDEYAGADHLANRRGQHLLIVETPGGAWVVDGRSFDGTTYGPGWVRTGEPPRVTVTPSVNIVGAYHGYLRDGVLTDDLEGRIYPEA